MLRARANRRRGVALGVAALLLVAGAIGGALYLARSGARHEPAPRGLRRRDPDRLRRTGRRLAPGRGGGRVRGAGGRARRARRAASATQAGARPRRPARAPRAAPSTAASSSRRSSTHARSRRSSAASSATSSPASARRPRGPPTSRATCRSSSRSGTTAASPSSGSTSRASARAPLRECLRPDARGLALRPVPRAAPDRLARLRDGTMTRDGARSSPRAPRTSPRGRCAARCSRARAGSRPPGSSSGACSPEVRREELWKEWGYPSFERYCAQGALHPAGHRGEAHRELRVPGAARAGARARAGGTGRRRRSR